jgi:inositol-phosphate transport system permease protein
MTAITQNERYAIRGFSSAKARQRANMVIFLGPAVVLTVLFYIIPVIVDIVVHRPRALVADK